MKSSWERRIFVICSVVVAACAVFATAEYFWRGRGVLKAVRAPAAEGAIPDFTLLDHRGDIHRLYQYKDSKFLVITAHGNGCPIVQKFTLKLNEVRRKYRPLGVELVLLNANQEDDRKSIIQEATDYKVEPPILMDPSQVVAKILGFSRTSETVVIDTRDWKIVYRGPINDQLDYGVDKQAARNEYLEHALDALLAGGVASADVPEAKGCLISYRQKKEISYTKDIAPIMAEKCLRCHSPPTKYPPILMTARNIRAWTAMIKETVITERMPPFSADPLYGPYDPDHGLTPEQKWLLVEWLDRGAPTDFQGEDPLKNYKRPIRPLADKIKNEKPVYTVQMAAPAPIPPGGEVEYKYFQLGGEIPEDLWIHTVLVKSTNPRQLHHASMMVHPKPLKFYEDAVAKDRDEKKIQTNKDGDIPLYTLWKMMEFEHMKDPHYNRIQLWAAGRPQPFGFGETGALYLPKGYYLTLETHYMGNGRNETEQTTVEFYGSNKKGRRKKVSTLMLSATKFEIPPGVKKFAVVTKPYKITKDMEIRALLGHLHMRGKAIRAVLRTPDGKSRTVASIPNFYYGWQTGAGINPSPPIFVPKGSQLTGICEFDNSATNPYNPDPTKTVYHGQTHDRTEMCHFNLQMLDAN